jgi:predicted Rossmann-fold nucleotide-binding protein
VFDVDDYYAPLFALFDRAVDEQFVKPQHRELANRATSVEHVLELIERAPPPPQPKWIGRDEV